MGSQPPVGWVAPNRAPAALLRQLGLSARKGLSQSFLTDTGVCQLMAEAAAVGPEDDVLEIGPGLGILTGVLVARAKRVVAVELDRRLAERLPELVPSGGLEVLAGDALAFDPSTAFGGRYKLVSNLPYQISSPVLHRYLIEVRRPEALVVMLQAEVAERLVAPPGRASYLTILVQAVASVRLVRRVPAGAFYPRPKVSSAAVAIVPRQPAEIPDAELPAFARLVRAGFAQPRKTLANSLAQGLSDTRASVEARLTAVQIDPRRRPQELAVEDWVRLFRAEHARR